MNKRLVIKILIIFFIIFLVIFIYSKINDKKSKIIDNYVGRYLPTKSRIERKYEREGQTYMRGYFLKKEAM